MIVFPKDFEKNREFLEEEQKIFVQGRVSVGDDPVGKLVCEKLIPFQALPRQLWLQFADKEAYDQKQELVMNALRSWEGQDQVVIYLAKERAKKVLPANWRVSCDAELLRNSVSYTHLDVYKRQQATAADVEELCHQVAEKVKEQSGVDLEMEIKRLG